MAAFCPSERIRFSNAGNRFAVAAPDGAPGAAPRATGFAELPAAAPPSLPGDALRAPWAPLPEEVVSCSRSCCSATSLRNSPSGVNSRRSTTLKVSSCLGSDNGFSLRHFSDNSRGGRILAPPHWRSQVPPPRSGILHPKIEGTVLLQTVEPLACQDPIGIAAVEPYKGRFSYRLY